VLIASDDDEETLVSHPGEMRRFDDE